VRAVKRTWLAGGTLAAGALLITLAAVVLVLGLMGADEVTAGPDWVPPSALGILAPLLGSVAVACGALLLGGGTAYLAATFLSFERPRARPVLLGLFGAGTWMPTVVLGLFGVVWLQPIIGGYGILAVIIVLSLAAFWPATAHFTAILDAVPREVLDGAIAIGADGATGRRLLAPRAVRTGLVRAVVGLAGRLVGEGTVTALLIGNNGSYPPALLHPSATMASVLLTEGGGAPPGSPWEGALWSLGLALAILAALLGRALGAWDA